MKFFFCIFPFLLLGCNQQKSSGPVVLDEIPVIFSMIDQDDSLCVFQVQKGYEYLGRLTLPPDSNLTYDTSDFYLNFSYEDPVTSIVQDNRLDLIECDTCELDFRFEQPGVQKYLYEGLLYPETDFDKPISTLLTFGNNSGSLSAIAQTRLVPCFNIKTPQWRCYNIASNPRMLFDELEIEFIEPKGGALINVYLTVLYFELPITGGIPAEKNTIDSPLFLISMMELEGQKGFDHNIKFDSLLFGDYLNSAIDTSNNAIVSERVAVTATFTFEIYNEDFKSYLNWVANGGNRNLELSGSNFEGGFGFYCAKKKRVIPDVLIQTNKHNYFDRWPSLKHS